MADVHKTLHNGHLVSLLVTRALNVVVVLIFKSISQTKTLSHEESRKHVQAQICFQAWGTAYIHTCHLCDVSPGAAERCPPGFVTPTTVTSAAQRTPPLSPGAVMAFPSPSGPLHGSRRPAHGALRLLPVIVVPGGAFALVSIASHLLCLTPAL